MIKFFFFLLITMISLGAHSEEVIVLDAVESRVIHEENVIDVIVGSPGIIEVKKVGGDYVVSPISPIAKTYIIFLKKDGSSKSYVIDIRNGRRGSSMSSSREKMISGHLSGRTTFSEGRKKDGQPYSLNLYTEIKTTENTRTILNVESYDDLSRKETELTYAQIYYRDNYILWSRFSEPTASIPYYLGSFYRGFTLGQKSLNTDFGVWTANRYESREEVVGSRAQGIFIYNSYFDFPYRLTLNNYKDRYIPTFSSTVIGLGLIHNLGFSFLDEKYLFRYSAVKTFNKNSEDFALRAITGYLSGAPKGSYGLYNQNDSFQQDYGSAVIFSNKEQTSIDPDKERDIDFMPGTFSTSLGYDHTTFQTTQIENYHGFFGYGNLSKLTLSGSVDYSKTKIYGLNSEIFSYSPRLSLFVVGDKYDGISLRNEYFSSAERDVVDNLNLRTRNIFGVYRNTRRYYGGIYGGSSTYESPTSTINSKIIGADYSYFFKDATAMRIGVENSSAETGGYQNKAMLSMATTFKKDLSVIAKITYLDNHDASGAQQSSTVGFLGFTWRFGAGTGNVYSAITEKMKSISGHVYHDLNFNGEKDSDEPYLSNINVSSSKSGASEESTDNLGYYKFSGFSSNEFAFVDIKSDKYSPVKSNSFSMEKSRTEDLGVYEGIGKKVFVQTTKGEDLPLSTLSFSCESNGKRLKRETYSNYFMVYLPKDIKCDVEIDTDQSVSALINEIKEKNGEIHVSVNLLPKILAFEFVTSITRPIRINNRTIQPKNGQIIEMIEHFEGNLKIKLGPNCKVFPNIEDFSYNRLKNQNIFKISCF